GGMRQRWQALHLAPFLNRFKSFLGKEVLLTDRAEALRDCERFCRWAAEQHVIGMIHHRPCDRNRIAAVLEPTDATGLEVAAVHDRSIEFEGAVNRHHRTPTGVEQ